MDPRGKKESQGQWCSYFSQPLHWLWKIIAEEKNKQPGRYGEDSTENIRTRSKAANYARLPWSNSNSEMKCGTEHLSFGCPHHTMVSRSLNHTNILVLHAGLASEKARKMTLSSASPHTWRFYLLPPRRDSVNSW